MHISVKLGVEGIMELLRRSVSAALPTHPNNDRLVMLLEKVVEKFDSLVGSFTHLDRENQMIQITGLGSVVAMKAKLSWTTLHSLLPSERKGFATMGICDLLEKANTVIDIMSSALSLMAQINETERMNILKVIICNVICENDLNLKG